MDCLQLESYSQSKCEGDVKITIPGKPIAKKRHKCGCRGGKPFAYDPQIDEEMKVVRLQILHAWNSAFDSENSEIELEASNLTQADFFYVRYDFIFPEPKKPTASQKKLKLGHWWPHNSKPDIDNLEKFYLDCCSGILWRDDSQVSCLSSVKYYGKEPKVIIEIYAGGKDE
jgi:hypothetical protein